MVKERCIGNHTEKMIGKVLKDNLIVIGFLQNLMVIVG